MKDVLVVGELADRKLRKTTLSALRFAEQAVAGTGGAFDVLLVGDGAKDAAAEVAAFGARKVLAADAPGAVLAEAIAPTVTSVAKNGGYGVVVATASTFGKDVMPRVAAKLDAGIASDISAVVASGGKLAYRRPMYAGNVFAQVEVTTPVHVVTVRQAEFAPAEAKGGASPIEAIALQAAPTASQVEFVKLEAVKSARPELSEARVVVSGGRALGSAEKFKTVLEPLVDAFGAAMGASRAAVDAGYVPGDLQVGQTGKVVAPKLYVAVGISGAIQHLAGMKGSKVIVSINKQKDAPISQVSDYFLTADLFQAVPELTEAVKKAKSQ